MLEFFVSGPICLKFGSEDIFYAFISNMKGYFTLEANIKLLLTIFCDFISDKAMGIP